MRGTTPNRAAVEALADEALKRPDGLIIDYLTTTYGDLDAANSAARSFQMAFSALRAAARDKAATRDERRGRAPFNPNTRGFYDGLSCAKRALPNGEGYKILLAPGVAMDFALSVRDAKTGEGLDEFNPRKQAYMNVSMFLYKEVSKLDTLYRQQPALRKPIPNPLTQEHEDVLVAWNLEEARALMGDFGYTLRMDMKDTPPAGRAPTGMLELAEDDDGMSEMEPD